MPPFGKQGLHVQVSCSPRLCRSLIMPPPIAQQMLDNTALLPLTEGLQRVTHKLNCRPWVTSCTSTRSYLQSLPLDCLVGCVPRPPSLYPRKALFSHPGWMRTTPTTCNPLVWPATATVLLLLPQAHISSASPNPQQNLNPSTTLRWTALCATKATCHQLGATQSSSSSQLGQACTWSACSAA